MATKVNLLLSINKNSLDSDDYIPVEPFPDFTGHIPRIGEYVLFYRHEHDGCQYCGVVTAIENRIEFKRQNGTSKKTMQDVIVRMDWKDNP